jgi:adenine-specific DNA methylase
MACGTEGLRSHKNTQSVYLGFIKNIKLKHQGNFNFMDTNLKNENHKNW